MKFEAITSYLDSLIDRDIPSVDCMIYENHKLLYRHMSGKVDINKSVDVTKDTDYLIFSMTKVLTMTAIMQLVEQGKVSLEDEVSKFLPAYSKLMVKNDNGTIALDKPLLIKHLLSMQSGLNYDLDRPGIVRVLNEKGMEATTRELVDAFAESPIDFVPGSHFQYSLSHDVVAAIIEVVSGLSFGEYMKKYIWEPIGMTRTRFAKPMNDDVENLAQQYIVDENGQTLPMEQSCNYQLSSCYESGGAGLISCTEDYAKLADTLASGGMTADGQRILKSETIEIMKTNLLNDDGLRDIEQTMGRKGYGYGCGVQVLMKPELIGSSAPEGVFGWDGAAGSCIIMDTASKRSLVYMQHVRNCGMAYGEIHHKLRDMLFE